MFLFPWYELVLYFQSEIEILIIFSKMRVHCCRIILYWFRKDHIINHIMLLLFISLLLSILWIKRIIWGPSMESGELEQYPWFLCAGVKLWSIKIYNWKEKKQLNWGGHLEQSKQLLKGHFNIWAHRLTKTNHSL